MKGIVYLVGAGPGDPGLVTVKGLEVLRRAQVVVYDQLANPSLLSEAPAGAELIYVGKKAGAHAAPQEDINDLLVARAMAGLTVVRLKGGDPFVFGRGGEEAEELAAAGVPFEIIPGVTSAIAVPAYAGIPVTHRRYTTLATFITGHEDPAKEESAIPWANLGRNPGTLVFLMGLKNLADNCRRLMAEGKAPDTPAAVIQSGTTLKQRTVTGTLADIAARAKEADIRPPAILVVGAVAELRDRLKWWETQPLWGKTVVVTRSREQASKLVDLLAAAGARCLEIPTLEIGPPDDYGPLDKALAHIKEYHWIVFTSANGVSAFMARLFGQGKDVRALGGTRLAVIGPATAEALRPYGLIPDVVPKSFVAEDLAAALAPHISPGTRVLLARAQVAREVLPETLKHMGAKVDEAPVYKARPPAALPPEADAALREGRIDVLTFTSSATVHNFAALLRKDRFQALAANATVAAIGPITAGTLQEYGLTPQIQPDSYTIPALVEAIVEHFTILQG
ncbi:MAG: uroporphyrinogen-III C-methyltransferase [Deltaproteobacteria bacterium]|nr:uroporphyrinogen-III C-methyltransferase [Deltaproteobacteria bacterium]